jgi:hypothetical protein
MTKKKIVTLAIQIPKELYDKIDEKIKGTSFPSVEEYVLGMLKNEFSSEPVYTKEEEALIKERLRKLGYIE